MSYPRQPCSPLDNPALERLALRYVERYATTRQRLVAYLARKIKQHGWSDSDPPDPEGLAERMVTLRYVDDRAWAESKAAALARRGLGAARVTLALRQAGVAAVDREAVAAEAQDQAMASALTFARRRQIGPFAPGEVSPLTQNHQIMAMIRAGHDSALARRIVRMAPGDELDEENTILVTKN